MKKHRKKWSTMIHHDPPVKCSVRGPALNNRWSQHRFQHNRSKQKQSAVGMGQKLREFGEYPSNPQNWLCGCLLINPIFVGCNDLTHNHRRKVFQRWVIDSMWRSLKHVAKGDLAAHWQPNSGACNAPSTPGQAEFLAMSCLDGWSLGCPHSSMFCCSPLLSGCRYQSSPSVWNAPTTFIDDSLVASQSRPAFFGFVVTSLFPLKKCNNWHTKLVEYHDYSRVILDCTPYPKTSWYDSCRISI